MIQSCVVLSSFYKQIHYIEFYIIVGKFMPNRNQVLSLATAVALYGCGAGTSGNNGSYTCPYPTFNSQIAEQLLTSWGQGLQKYNLANNADIYTSAGYFTMSYYAPDAVLQPTLSYIQREGTQAIYSYFTGFLSVNPIMSFNPESNDTLAFGCGFGGYVGYYSFITNPGTLQESTVEGRFTFNYIYLTPSFTESFTAIGGVSNGQTFRQINQPGWYILVQQSSVLPGF